MMGRRVIIGCGIEDVRNLCISVSEVADEKDAPVAQLYSDSTPIDVTFPARENERVTGSNKSTRGPSPDTSTRPSFKAVKTGRWRATVMGPVADQRSVAGSKISPANETDCGPYPPTNKTLPSIRVVAAGDQW